MNQSRSHSPPIREAGPGTLSFPIIASSAPPQATHSGRCYRITFSGIQELERYGYRPLFRVSRATNERAPRCLLPPVIGLAHGVQLPPAKMPRFPVGVTLPPPTQRLPPPVHIQIPPRPIAWPQIISDPRGLKCIYDQQASLPRDRAPAISSLVRADWYWGARGRRLSVQVADPENISGTRVDQLTPEQVFILVPAEIYALDSGV